MLTEPLVQLNLIAVVMDDRFASVTHLVLFLDHGGATARLALLDNGSAISISILVALTHCDPSANWSDAHPTSAITGVAIPPIRAAAKRYFFSFSSIRLSSEMRGKPICSAQ